MSRTWLACLLLCVAAVARADDPCAGFEWDVSVERALFAGEATALVAGLREAGAPSLAPGVAYALALAPTDTVTLPVAPTKPPPPGRSAGLARVRLAAPGRYRIALDAAAWLDVVVDGHAVPAHAFQGRHGCTAPRKIVEFELPAGELLLELSAAEASPLRLVVRGPVVP